MLNRQKHEMYRDILAVCNGGSLITHVMFRTYITHAQAKAYLGELIDAGLVEYDAPEKKYHTSNKGLQYLNALESMTEMFAIETRKAKISA